MTDTAPDSLGADLFEHLYRAFADAQPGSHWVMNLEWLNECRKIGTRRWPLLEHIPAAVTETMLGLPIEVREDGGVPHLEV